MQINFICSKDSNGTRNMHTKSDNIKVVIGSETNYIIEKLRKSLLQNYQKGLEESIRGSEFVRDSIDLFYYHLQKICFKSGESYIDSLKWLKNKKARINPKNKDDKCFQYALTVALNYKQIKNHSERISNLKPFIDQYNWKGIFFSAQPSKE